SSRSPVSDRGEPHPFHEPLPAPPQSASPLAARLRWEEIRAGSVRPTFRLPPARARGNGRRRLPANRKWRQCSDDSARRWLAPHDESGRAFGILRERVGKHLDRNVTIELRVARPIDFPHPANT